MDACITQTANHFQGIAATQVKSKRLKGLMWKMTRAANIYFSLSCTQLEKKKGCRLRDVHYKELQEFTEVL